MSSLLRDLCADLKERLERKIRDSNRTLTAISSDRRKTVEIDGVHSDVFAELFPDLPSHCIVRDLSSLVKSFPPASLLRVHHSGDFCLVAPVQQSSDSMSYLQLLSLLSSARLPTPTWLKEGFSVASGQLLLPLSRHGDSNFLQVACPFPGSDDSVDEDLYPDVPFPVSLPVTGDVTAGECPFFREKGRALLHQVRKNDVRVCVENSRARRLRMLGKEANAGGGEEAVCEQVEIGEKLIVRGEEYVVVGAEINPYMPHGMQQVIVNKAFVFSARNVPVRVQCSIVVRCHFGLVPDVFLHDFEPVTVDFSPNHTNCGRLSLTFSTVSFNRSLASHRNPFAFCTSLESSS